MRRTRTLNTRLDTVRQKVGETSVREVIRELKKE
jgi:hypothetical protein